MDKNEEEHIPENREIPIELDYVDINSDVAIFHFKSPVSFITYDVENSTISSVSQITYARSESTLFGDYVFEHDNNIESYYLLYDPRIGSAIFPGNINVYGKEDKHADRLIIGLSWDVYFECERM